MYKKLLAFFALAANATIWAGFARLVAETDKFIALNTELDKLIQQQEYNTKGITKGKNEAFNDMIKLTIAMAYKAFVWANDANKAELIELFDVQLDDFDGMAAETAFDKVKNIRNAINKNIGSMAGVNLLPADVAALDVTISNYNKNKSTPGIAKSHKKSVTKTILDTMQAIDKSIILIDRLLLSQYGITNSGMVSDFLNNKKINSLPGHHTGLQVHFTDAATGLDLEGATLQIQGTGKNAKTNKTTSTDINGIAQIIKTKRGPYHTTLSMLGYKTQHPIITLKQGKILNLTIQLQPTTDQQSDLGQT